MSQLLRIHEVRLELHDLTPDGRYVDEVVRKRAAHKLGISPTDIVDHRIVRESVDARKDIHFKLTVDVALRTQDGVRRLKKRGYDIAPPPFVPLHRRHGFLAPAQFSRPVVVGLGPAGLFAALQLAYAGMRPIVLEQGDAVERRAERVAEFWRTGVLDPYSNVQFGEGGAGTFSDGKLTTRIKDERISFVLDELVAAGAPEEIRYRNKPHIGTDLLSVVVYRLRERIKELGGSVNFCTRVTGIELGPSGTLLVGAERRDQDRPGTALESPTLEPRTPESLTFETDALILATGHSGREMFEIVRDFGLPMERKPFAVGFRIEHPQRLIDRAQYGQVIKTVEGMDRADAAARAASAFDAGQALSLDDVVARLGAADYKLAYTTASGRSVYSFCMCPGGRVVGAASEHGRLVVNGMSYHARSEANANAALLVNVDPSDLGETGGVLAGVEFQRRLERAAFCAARDAQSAARGSSHGVPYTAPAQRVGDYLARRVGVLNSFAVSSCAASSSCSAAQEGERLSDPCFRDFKTSFEPGVVACDLRSIVPDFVADAIAEAIPQFGKKINGFDDPNALLIGVESRSSSPVRIVRDPVTLRSRCGLPIYPCGEGAGYAGGITSAAVDGVRVAEAVIEAALIASGDRR